jgi:tRNA(fMet)-specific endonuclease VapC
MSGKIALDTDIAIKFLNGDKKIEAFINRFPEIYLPVIVAGELIFGALNSKHSKQNLS